MSEGWTHVEVCTQIWTWKQWDRHAFDELIYFHARNIPPGKAGLSSSCHAVVSPALLALPQPSWPAGSLGLASSHCPVWPPGQPCAFGQVELVFCGPLFCGATLLTPLLPYRTLHQQLWEAPTPVHLQARPGKTSWSISSEVPQPAKHAIIQRLQFISLLLPHRYPWEKTNLQKNSLAS